MVHLKKNKRLTATDVVKNSKMSLDVEHDVGTNVATDYFDGQTNGAER